MAAFMSYRAADYSRLSATVKKLSVVNRMGDVIVVLTGNFIRSSSMSYVRLHNRRQTLIVQLHCFAAHDIDALAYYNQNYSTCFKVL